MHDDLSSISTNAKNIYETAQHASASRHGNALFSSFTSSTNDGPLRSRRADASLRSSINTVESFSFALAPQSRGVSGMGHRLLHIYAPEEEYGLELDREEMKRLAMGHNAAEQDSDEELLDNGRGGANNQLYGQSPSSTRVDPSDEISKSTMIYPDGSLLSKADQARIRFNDQLSSPACQQTLVLLGILLLLGVCLIFTLVSMEPKTYDDWIEPNRDAYMNEGIDWAPGSDAPPRFDGAKLDPLIENNIANWALGTLRIPPEAAIDGYGSISMSQVALARDVPLFFGQEYTGVNLMDMLLGQCLNLIQAGRLDSSDDLTKDRISMVFLDGRKYVNVDTTTSSGIDRAYSLGLVSSDMADLIYSPLLHEVSSLFSSKNQARLFVMLRHPVEAQFARFRHLRANSSRDTPERQDELMKMSYEDFSNSEFIDDNWFTRALVHKIYGETLTPQDMETAKEVLRRKAIIGLYDAPIMSFKKYARYFNWDRVRLGGYFTDETEKCFENVLEVVKKKDEVGALNLRDEDSMEGSAAWENVMERNRFDYELYMYGQHLYKYQLGLN